MLITSASMGKVKESLMEKFFWPAGISIPASAPNTGGNWSAAYSQVIGHYVIMSWVQRANGELTIGDTHAYDEPFDFAVEEEAYAYLLARAERILGASLPPVRRRWAGVYSQSTDDRVVHRAGPVDGVAVDGVAADRVVVVTGLGGRGMTLAPAVAEETFAELDA